MVKLIVIFRQIEEPSTEYDQAYNHFLILLDRLPGMRRKAVDTVYAGPGGPAPFGAVVEVVFDSPEALQTALISPAGVEAGQYLLEFAGADAITLFAESLEEGYPAA